MTVTRSNQKKQVTKSEKVIKKPDLNKSEKKFEERTEKKDGALVETARKVETSARIVGDKTYEVVEKVSDQTTEIAEMAFDKIKKGVSDAVDISTKTMSEMSKKASKYIKKYENTIEMRKIIHERNDKFQELGTYLFNLYQAGSQNINELLSDDEAQRLLAELDLINKNIVKLGRKIKRKI